MFAVKGWSVPADKLKSEAQAAAAPKPGGPGGREPEPKARKRRRPGGGARDEVTDDNVAALWERVIEHKKPKLERKPRDRQAAADGDAKPPASGGEEGGRKERHAKPGRGAPAAQGGADQPGPENKDKKHKKDKRQKRDGAAQDAAAKPPPAAAAAHAARPAPAPPKLTPLQASMREKLISARFRHLNETLYTRPSAEAYRLFQESPEMFQEYHEGFRRQVDVWPENPVDGYVREIRLRGRQRTPPRARDRRGGRFAQPQPPQPPQPPGAAGAGAVPPLPRTHGTCIIADLGCGDATLARALQEGGDAEELRLDVRSFDLHNPSPLVTRADVADLPLEDGSVDVAIFCLALMGTNWLDFIEEAYRVLHWKGELWVAEIKSRFGHVGRAGAGAGAGGKKAPGGVVEHSVGHRRKAAAAGGAGGKKGRAAAEDAAAAAEAELAVEVDGVEDGRQQTDVSAFVEALRLRGFVPHGEGGEAVDLSNRMFVRMRFLKAAPAVRGKMAAAEGPPGGRGGGPPRKGKFVEREDEAGADEAAILKPCVYKIR